MIHGASHGMACLASHSSLTIVPTLRVVMPFVTLCVTMRFYDLRWIGVRLKAPFRPSATDFEGSK
ncbi:hypothetical protein CFN58_06985 [Pseudomonas avellanae]|uniref:Uncharacterized protein n=2 Tax=Pseudomonas syringae group TaxID=136849 RepID=A0A261WLC5_9PSED|nr:hypothetical protein JN853_21465 [Pseudomonas syringae pv. actinidiae ICMP 9853]ATV19123.1 hypothetical protein CT122_21690 [Pseudomonas syringae pv. actinidiae]OZI86994.1 hypothetical protein CFN58_06985 [Pseudomonas avellanae]PIN59813.1 hypothetical protein CUB86_19890 [Pseudomonas syringae pv. actinidiae]